MIPNYTLFYTIFGEESRARRIRSTSACQEAPSADCDQSGGTISPGP
jgi:hypothetical protein